MTVTKIIASAAAAALLSYPVLAHELPLGDGKVSGAPKAGYVFSCRRNFRPPGPGAGMPGSWMSAGSYDPEKKPVVGGRIDWPSRIGISLTGDIRTIRANGLPSNPTGRFPIPPRSKAYKYDRNPNHINEQDIVLSLPANPVPAERASCLPMGMIGIALSGASIFNALDDSGRDAPAHEIRDECDGHPQHWGQYHYHSLSSCFRDKRDGTGGHSSLFGYALDGFGIYGKYDENGRKLANGDLDACHGHTHTIMWDGKMVAMYHYHATDSYPYTIGCFRGRPAR
jgi:hypothetical protein